MKTLILLLTVMTLQLSAGPATDYTFVRMFGQPGPESNQFLRMDGIGVDRFGNVFISDDMLWIDPAGGFTNTIPAVKRWSTDGMFEHSWEKYQNDQYWPPQGLDCSCDGDPFYSSPTYINQKYGADIEHTSPNGNLYEKFPDLRPLQYWCRDVAVSADGYVYGIIYYRIPNESTNIEFALIMKFDWNGTVWSNRAITIVTNEFGMSRKAWGIDADPWRQRVYVTCLADASGRAGIKVYDMDLNRIENHLPWGYLAQPTGVAVDNRNGSFLVTEAASNMIYKFTEDVVPVLQFGGPGTDPYQFNKPTDLDVDLRGWLYVADSGNDRVQVFAPPKEGNLNFIVYKSKIKVGWKQKIKGLNRDLILCKALAAIDVYTNITGMVGMPFSFWLNDLEVIPEMVPTKTNKKGTKALYAWDKDHKAKVQYRPDGALLRITVKLKRGNVNGPLNIFDSTPLPPWLWTTAQMTLSNEYLGVHYMRLIHKNKVGKVYKALKR